MKKTVFVIGATGTIGSAVVGNLQSDYQVLKGSRTQGVHIDLGDLASIASAMDRIANEFGQIDGIVCCAGGGMIGPIAEYDLEDFLPRLNTKLLGQVAVVREGSRIVRPEGAIVLTSGMLEKHPQHGTSHLAVINAALGGFVRAAAVEMDPVRVCVVSPGLVNESSQKVLDLFDGMTRIAGAELADVYRMALAEGESGATYDAFGS